MKKPRRLCIKKHRVTGLLYFCSTGKIHIEAYKGSGPKWLEHIRDFGRDIETIWVSRWYQPNEKEKLRRFALLFSRIAKIMESDKWANQMEEDGIQENGYRKIPSKPEAYAQGVLTRIKNNGKYNDQDGMKNPSWKGWWVTPWGTFETLKKVFENKPKDDYNINGDKMRVMMLNNIEPFGFIPKSHDDSKSECNETTKRKSNVI